MCRVLTPDLTYIGQYMRVTRTSTYCPTYSTDRIAPVFIELTDAETAVRVDVSRMKSAENTCKRSYTA
jgi:hypothetical protein